MLNKLRSAGTKLQAWATPQPKDSLARFGPNPDEAWRHLESSNWEKAEKQFLLTLSGKQSPAERVELLVGLAQAQRRQGKHSEAEGSARQAIKLAAELQLHASRLEAMSILVDLHQDRGQNTEAHQLAEEIVRLEGAQVKPNPIKLVQYTRKLGFVLFKNGQSDQAQVVFERAVGMAEQNFGPEHEQTGDSLSGLGMVFRQEGNHGEAQRCLRRASNIHRLTRGPDSKEVTEDLYHLAASLEESGDVNGAVSEYEKVVLSKERQIAGDPVETAMAKVRLGALYLQVGRSSSTRELLIHAIRVLEKTGGDGYLLALEILACAEEHADRPAQADIWRQKGIAIVTKQEKAKEELAKQELAKPELAKPGPAA